MKNAKDIGSQIKPKYVGGGTATAAGTGDNTAVNGADLGRVGYQSAVLVIAYTATLTEDKTLSFAISHEDSPDGSTRSTAVVDQAATVAATGPAGGGTVTGIVEVDADLSGANAYRRYIITPDLNASSTDTCAWRAVWILGGADVVPAV